jgi:NAD(P)-dependent dehydrogenase (short-subunit alcohol dehydrogenase family)
MGPEDHIQVDLADPEGTGAAIVEIKRRLDAGKLNALVNNAAISPKAEGGKRLSLIDTTIDVWNHIFQVNFFAPIMLARGETAVHAMAHGSCALSMNPMWYEPYASPGFPCPAPEPKRTRPRPTAPRLSSRRLGVGISPSR